MLPSGRRIRVANRLLEEIVMAWKRIAVFGASIAVLGRSTRAGDVGIPTFTDKTSTRLVANASTGDADISKK